MKRTIVLIVVVLLLAGAAVYQNRGKQDVALAASAEYEAQAKVTPLPHSSCPI